MIMNRRIWICISLSALFVLTGCWDRAELPEKGFVMGIAIDKTDEGKILLTTQIYRPSQGVSAIGAKAADTAYMNVTTENDTVSRAIRDIPINLGRKAQWSHIRLIIIGEKLAREQEIYDVLHFFYRDHEPRLTISLLIAKGKADQYLKIEPLIENTTSQQLFQSAQSASSSSGKAIFTDLLKLGIQLKSEVGNALVPYLYFTDDPPTVTNVAGTALIKKGKLVGRMEPKMTENLQMLLGEYQSGMIDIPCPGPTNNSKKTEVVEIIKFQGKLQPTILTEDLLKVRVRIKLELALIELACSDIMTIEDQKKFTRNVEETIKGQIEETIDWLKQKKFDAVGLGNKVYIKNPHLWKQWKPDWDDRFARAQFDIDVKVKITNSGTSIPKTAIKK
ncbi:Ger(x)C family spore germination protein [Cohnella suwonensis]|uniref:Ger(X)C family spore germination protein n=1 Tax=Cohnella suwonensis TaxID=696072 RepID=A0ABW0LSI8_9BACL